MTHCLEVFSSLSFTRTAHLRTLIVAGIVSLAPSNLQTGGFRPLDCRYGSSDSRSVLHV